MKIIVHDEEEWYLLENFFSLIHDLDLIDKLEEIDQKEAMESNDPQYLKSIDWDFLRQTFFMPRKLVFEKSEPPMTIEHDNIQGVCTMCGTYTEGHIDGNEVSYAEFLDYSSEDAHKNWKCETCFFKED